jgi:hypothetical protein
VAAQVSVWTWTYEDAEGREAQPVVRPPERGFGTQADAETWIGENWRALLAGGVEQVDLLCDDRKVYGPMGLRPAE